MGVEYPFSMTPSPLPAGHVSLHKTIEPIIQAYVDFLMNIARTILESSDNTGVPKDKILVNLVFPWSFLKAATFLKSLNHLVLFLNSVPSLIPQVLC